MKQRKNSKLSIDFNMSNNKLLILFVPLISLSFEIDLRLKLADSLFYAEKFNIAESLYNMVVQTAQGIDRGVCLKGLGNIALSYGNPEQAHNYYIEALKLFKENHYFAGEAKIYLNFGSIAFYQGDYSKSREFFEKALQTIGRIKEKTREEIIDEININAMLGRLFLAQNDYKKANDGFGQAIVKAKTLGYSKGIIDGYYHLGNLFAQRAEVDSALFYFAQSCSLALVCKYYKSAYESYREIGNIKRRIGEYDDAYVNLYNALHLVDSIKTEREFVIGEGELLNNIALLYQDMGKYRSALDGFFSAYNIFDKTDNRVWKIEALQNIGFVYTILAQTESVYYDSALYFYQLIARSIRDRREEAEYFNNLGILYERKGDYKNAQLNYEKALRTFEILQDKIARAKVLCNIGNLYVNKGDYKKGIKIYQDGYIIIENMNRKDWQASILSNLGYAQYKGGDIDGAINSLGKAVAIIEDLRGKISGQEFRSVFLENKIVAYETLIDLYYQKGDVPKVFNYIEKAKSRAFLDLLSGVSIAQTQEMDLNIRSLIDREQELEQKIEFLSGDPAQSAVIIEHNNILKTLLEKYPSYGALKVKDPVDIKMLQSILDENTALIEYFVGPSKSYVVVITDRNLSAKRIDVPPSQICENIDQYRKIIRRKVKPADDDFSRLSQWFYTNLLFPLMPEIKFKKNLCIIPYGALHNLPFATIFSNREPIKLLIDDYDIFYAPSASVYAIAHGKNKIRKNKSVIFAKSSFLEHPEWFDLPLPGTKNETDSIVKLNVLHDLKVFSDADSLLPQPSETNAKNYLGEFDIIHFATHGKLAPGDSALSSRIILSADEDNDGNLNAREIFTLKLNAYLVTLSACETGQLRGFSETGYIGDELTGLSRAFIYAGASSVVASLWKVSDVSTALLMMHFYANLKNSSKIKALCDAQRWLMKQEYYDRPFFWAPFVVVGDWQ